MKPPRSRSSWFVTATRKLPRLAGVQPNRSAKAASRATNLPHNRNPFDSLCRSRGISPKQSRQPRRLVDSRRRECGRWIGKPRLECSRRFTSRWFRRTRPCRPPSRPFRVGGKAVHSAHGTKDVLAYVHGPGSWSRFRSAAMVGTGRNDPNFYLELVGGLSQRLVLDFGFICAGKVPLLQIPVPCSAYP